MSATPMYSNEPTGLLVTNEPQWLRAAITGPFLEAGWTLIARPLAPEIAEISRAICPWVTLVAVERATPSVRHTVRALASSSSGSLLMLIEDMAAKDAELLDAGADSCLHMRGNDAYLASSIRSTIRRAVKPDARPGRSILVAGDLALDAVRREASIAGVPLDLRRSHFEMLRILAARAPHIVPQGELMEAATGQPYSEYSARAAARVYVQQLRRKLHEGGIPGNAITGVRGYGYLLNPRLCRTRLASSEVQGKPVLAA